MAELLKTETLAVFLFFVVPGFLAIKVYDLIVPSERRNFGESVVDLVTYRCERCGHEWVPREEGKRPRVCPNCKSPYWDTPRKRDIKTKGKGEK